MTYGENCASLTSIKSRIEFSRKLSFSWFIAVYRIFDILFFWNFTLQNVLLPPRGGFVILIFLLLSKHVIMVWRGVRNQNIWVIPCQIYIDVFFMIEIFFLRIFIKNIRYIFFYFSFNLIILDLWFFEI